MIFFQLVTLVGSVVGGLMILWALLSLGASAPQQAAMAAIGIGLSVVPYVIFRVLQAERLDKQIKQFLAGQSQAPAPAPAPAPANYDQPGAVAAPAIEQQEKPLWQSTPSTWTTLVIVVGGAVLLLIFAR